jgi:DNA helicase-2/ATP-dependent DNA helicase PcrA
LTLLPGIGGKKARQLLQLMAENGWSFQAWSSVKPPEACREKFHQFVQLVTRLHDSVMAVAAQLDLIRNFYAPLLEEKFGDFAVRLRDLEQLELIASRYEDRVSMLSEITLDPPSSTEDLAGDPLIDEDYLILSTIHSSKGLEWDSVFIIHASDGNIPSDMSTKNEEQIEEERRLFYVALTRAKNDLYVCFPLRYYQGHRGGLHDYYGMAQLTRFVSKPVKNHFRIEMAHSTLKTLRGPLGKTSQTDIRNGLKATWA